MPILAGEFKSKNSIVQLILHIIRFDTSNSNSTTNSLVYLIIWFSCLAYYLSHSWQSFRCSVLWEEFCWIKEEGKKNTTHTFHAISYHRVNNKGGLYILKWILFETKVHIDWALQVFKILHAWVERIHKIKLSHSLTYLRLIKSVMCARNEFLGGFLKHSP